MKLVSFIAVCISFFILTPTAMAADETQNTVVAQAPTLTPGNTWIWSDNAKNGQLRRETFENPDGENLIFRMGLVKNPNNRIRVRTKEMNLINDVKNDGKEVTANNPHSGLLSFPLFIGKKWEHKYISQGTSKTINRHSRYEVDAYEKVTTPAGTFDAFSIKGYDQREDKPYGITVKFWYAPQVRNIVKFIGQDGYNGDLIPGWNFILEEYTIQ